MSRVSGIIVFQTKKSNLDNLERVRWTLIELDSSFTLSPRSSSLPSSMPGELDREVELNY